MLIVSSTHTLGWTGLIRVDNETYTWMGAPENISLADQTAFEYTATKSIFTIQAADKVAMKVTFLSPLTPKDLKRQSLVFSYMKVEINSMDGKAHDVQIYTDINAGMSGYRQVNSLFRLTQDVEWVSGDSAVKAQWDFGLNKNVVYHRLSRQDQQTLSEVTDRAEWGDFVSQQHIRT